MTKRIKGMREEWMEQKKKVNVGPLHPCHPLTLFAVYGVVLVKKVQTVQYRDPSSL
jgi:hypothetical protein